MAWQRPSGFLQTASRAAQPSSFYPVSIPLARRPQATRRTYATESQSAPLAAPEIDFSKFANRPARVVPASPAYFTARPKFIDRLLDLERLLAKHESLPIVPPREAPQMAWLKLEQLRENLGERVTSGRFREMMKTLQRLNQIDPALAPQEVRSKLQEFLRPGNPFGDKPAPPTVDELGRARARGKRKSSTAVVQLVEGEGEFMVNGQSLLGVFNRLHDRESATWPLRCVQRLDKYNVWATVKGGGVTGQAEAITLAVARALLIHEPALKPLLRKGMHPTGLGQNTLLICCSWCCYGGCQTGGEKEARSSQSAQGPPMGQEVNTLLYSMLFNSIVFWIRT